MALRITIDIFSGRPNPVVELEGDEEADLLARLRPERKLTAEEARPTPDFMLGYRGLVIEQTGEQRPKGLPPVVRVAGGQLFAPKLAAVPADPALEDELLGKEGVLQRLGLDAKVLKAARKQRKTLAAAREAVARKPVRWPVRPVCRCAPPYEPEWWNDGGERQFNNNCYNYATNYRTDTFAQPGQAAGAIYTSLTCGSVRPAAVKDQLVNAAGADNKCPGEGDLVALVIWPGSDFHWYRKGRNGLWTHKPGGTPATNLDNSGATIPDPRTADRGPYTQFCTFMIVRHGHIKIA